MHEKKKLQEMEKFDNMQKQIDELLKQALLVDKEKEVNKERKDENKGR